MLKSKHLNLLFLLKSKHIQKKDDDNNCFRMSLPSYLI